MKTLLTTLGTLTMLAATQINQPTDCDIKKKEDLRIIAMDSSLRAGHIERMIAKLGK